MKAMLFTVAVLAFAGACGNSSNGPSDASPADAPKDGSVTVDASCFDISGITNPTHYQIINACTTADKIYKDSHPPLQNPDGSLPPLP
jgi:hypothetical protein